MENKQELPAGWKWVKLGEVCEINPSRRKIFGRSPDAPTSFVPMESVDEVSGKISKVFIVPYSKVAKGYTYFEENDILFAKITPCMQNGKHAIAKNLIDGIGFGTTEFHVIRPSNAIIPEWVWFFIRQKAFLNEAMNYFTGSVGQQRVPKNFLSEHITPLPPLSEQKRIAEKLKAMMDEIEEAKASIEKQLEAAKTLPSAYLSEVFESPEAQKWEKKKLREVISVIESGGRPKGGVLNIKDGVPSIGAEHLNSSGGFNFTNIRFIPKEFYEVMKKGKIQYGDVLIVKDGATTGRVSFVRNDFPFEHAALNEHVFRLRGNNLLDQEFLFYFLLSPSGQEQIQNEFHGSAQGGINQQFVNTIFIPLPPLSEQKRIASYLKEKIDQAEKLRETLEKELETLNALPQSILSKAFRGEI